MSYLADTLPVCTARPNWATPVTETLAWRTDYLTARDGSRQKRQMRLAPRRHVEFEALATGADRAALEAFRYAMGAGECLLPGFADVQMLATALPAGSSTFACETAGRDFAVGAGILIYSSAREWETATLSAFDAIGVTLTAPTEHAFAAGALIYPLRRALLADGASETRLADSTGSVALAFDINEPCDWTATAPASLYRGLPVLAEAPDESGDATAAYHRVLETVDANTGPVTHYDLSGLPQRLQDHRWLASGRSAYAALRSLLYWCAGRMGTLWVPSFMSDLTLAADISASATSLSVAWCGYTQLSKAAVQRRDLRIECYDGTLYLRRITNAVESGANETLTIDSALGTAVPRSAVRRVSFMMLAELSSDEIQIEHLTDADGLTRVAAKWQGLAHDL